MTHEISLLPAYTRRSSELRAAEYYAHTRKPESDWKTIADLAPQLAEFEHRVKAKDYDQAARMLEAIDLDYLSLWGHYTRLAGMREKLLDHLILPHLCATNLGNLGSLYRHLGRPDDAIRMGEAALDIARSIADPEEESVRLLDIGLIYRELGQLEQAMEYYQKALLVARQIDQRVRESVILSAMGSVYRTWRQIGQAIVYFKEALKIAQDIGYQRGEGVTLGQLGLTYSTIGQFAQAIEGYRQASKIALKFGDRRNESIWLGHLGRANYAFGHYEDARQNCEEALLISREIGHRRTEVIWLNTLGSICCATNQTDRAIHYYEEALAIAQEIRYRDGESYQWLGLTKSLLTVRRITDAFECCSKALAIDTFDTRDVTRSLLGVVLLHQNDPNASDAFAQAIAHSRTLLDQSPGLYLPQYVLALALVGQTVCDIRWSDPGQRLTLLIPTLAEYQRALDITAAVGVVNDAIRDLELIRAAGIGGLEPVFDLLEGALHEQS